MKPLILIALLAGVLWASDSITTVSPLTKIDVLKVQVQGYDTSKIFLAACIDKYNVVTMCVPQDILPYIQQDTANGIAFHPQGVNLRWTLKDFDKDSTVVKSFVQLLKKNLKSRVTLK